MLFPTTLKPHSPHFRKSQNRICNAIRKGGLFTTYYWLLATLHPAQVRVPRQTQSIPYPKLKWRHEKKKKMGRQRRNNYCLRGASGYLATTISPSSYKANTVRRDGCSTDEWMNLYLWTDANLHGHIHTAQHTKKHEWSVQNCHLARPFCCALKQYKFTVMYSHQISSARPKVYFSYSHKTYI